MIEMTGAYSSAKIFTDRVDSASLGQVQSLLNQPFTAGRTIRMMPDIHAGTGCTIGTTMTVDRAVCPNLVGVDIGCGMEVSILREEHLELQQLDKVIHERVPAGFDRRRSPHRYADRIDLNSLRCAKHVQIDKARVSLGSLGGGNHFIEADRDDDGRLYLVVHSGSRHLGLEVANWYQKAAREQELEGPRAAAEEEFRRKSEELRAAGRGKEVPALRRQLKASLPAGSGPLACCTGGLFDDYIHDMKLVQEFAALSRQAMTDEIVRGLGLHVEDGFTTIHNYIDTESMILRKGAVSAREGERLIIPINMRDGSMICMGKGNPDWNCSAPHGAGRLMSRSEAKESFTVSAFKKEMEGIYSTTVNRSTLDECPMAYKDMADIVDNIGPTADIVKIIRPVYNFKAGVDD